MKMVVDCPPGAEVEVSFGLATDLKFVPPPKGPVPRTINRTDRHASQYTFDFQKFSLQLRGRALQLLDTCAGKTSLQVRILRSIQQRTMLSVTHDSSAF